LLHSPQIRMAKVEKLKNNESNQLSFYIHIPYCSKRCGYCDFNTYTPSELTPGATLAQVTDIATKYIDAALLEIDLAARTAGTREVPTIFFGGGTPSLLPAREISRVIERIKSSFDVETDVEITLEANPDSLSREFLEGIKQAGVSRISLGMQSAVPKVLETLDRTHNPDNVFKSAQLIKEVGFEHLSVDLIYGTPGESISDWEQSYKSALDLPIDHVSAYALIVEQGTKLAAQIKRGEKQLPPDDETAEKYLLFDSFANRQGFAWYELSNWAKPRGECRHNIAYWNGSNWWGVGPGAHSFLKNRRWWNVKHPVKYQQLIMENRSPEQSSEELTEENRRDENLMLQIRMRSGIPISDLNDKQTEVAKSYFATEHLDEDGWTENRLVLSPKGRLIADRIVRELLV
jgi:putative oxygen-independent coproporphyrinogen III oxidase